MYKKIRRALIGLVVAPFMMGEAIHASKKMRPSDIPPQANGIHYNGLEIAIGKLHAPLTIIMYYSLSCPHCHDFQEKELPKIQKDFIDTGLVRFIFRDFPTDSLAVHAAKIAWCMGKDHYLSIAKKLLATQDVWSSRDPETFKDLDKALKESEEALHRIAQEFGITDKAYKKCVADKNIEDTILQTSFKAQKEYQISAAPAFVINGKLHDAELTAETIHEILLKMGLHP